MSIKKVLSVDDDYVAQMIISGLNNQLLFADQLVYAYNGEEALEAVKAEHFDLILLDLNMPVMGGFEFMDALTEPGFLEGAAIPPIYLLTSSIDPAEKERAKAYPFVKGYINKPLRKEDMNNHLILFGEKIGIKGIC